MSETHFPLDESKLSFEIPRDEKPREKILKLGRKITDRIPATDEVGDLSIPVDGVINAIGGATLTDAAAEVDVYTLSGVKVRAKVKASEATKGLPAGLYIVGGQKVLVK